jgi:hypothetical protein
MPILSCSHCQVRLKLADNVLGKNVKCPKCGQIFEAAWSATFASGPSPKRPVREEEERSPRSIARRRADADEDDRPARSRRRRRQPRLDPVVLAVGVTGGVALVALAVVVAFLLFRSPEAPVVAVQAIKEDNRAREPVQVAQVAAPPQIQAAPVQAPVENTNPPDQTEQIPDVPEPPAKPPSERPPIVKLGKKITVRAAMQGAPRSFVGDYNKHVVQNLEVALRALGYEPVANGGLPLVVRVTVGTSSKQIKVREIGARPPSMQPRIKNNPGQPPTITRPGSQNTQVYTVPQLTASVVLTDEQGVALWKKDNTITPFVGIFRGDPAREMEEVMWRNFEAWTNGPALATLGQ